MFKLLENSTIPVNNFVHGMCDNVIELCSWGGTDHKYTNKKIV